MDVINPTTAVCIGYCIAAALIVWALFGLGLKFPVDVKRKEYERYDSAAAIVKCERNRSVYGYQRWK